jgi:lipopolysaccharide export LptBFGC system permease protein LptF
MAKLLRMKLLSASLVYLAFAIAMGVGIVLLTAGKPALLIGAVLVYLAMLGKIGCAAH